MKLSRGAKFPVRPHRVILDQAAIFYDFPLSSAKTHRFHANLETSQGKNPSCVSSKSSDLFDFRFTWQSRYLIGVTASLQPPCTPLHQSHLRGEERLISWNMLIIVE